MNGHTDKHRDSRQKDRRNRLTNRQTGKHIYILNGHTDKLKNIETDRHTYRQKD